MAGQHAPQESPREPGWVTGAAYTVLAVLGAVLGVIGSFEFSWEAGSIPVAALVVSAVNLAVFRLAGWAMESRLGAVLPAVAWLIVTVILSSKRPEGDLVVTGTAAGYVYIFGGSIAAIVAVAWTRSPRPWILHGVSPASDLRR